MDTQRSGTFLDAALWSMRLKQQATTKFSPFKVLYDQEPKFPIEFEDLPETLEVVKCLNTIKTDYK